MLVPALAVLAACSSAPVPTPPRPQHLELRTVPEVHAAARATAPHYDLRLDVDVVTKEIAGRGRVTSQPPRTRFFLNEALVLDELLVEGRSVPFSRNKNRIEVTELLATFDVRYHGHLERRPGARDFKSDPWVSPDEVRLTEVTAFYPIFFDGTGDFPWPPVAGTGRLTVAPAPHLTWVTSSQRQEGETFVFSSPSDFVLVGVPFTATTIPVRTRSANVDLSVCSPRASALGPQLVSAMSEHLERFGPLREPTMNVVEFPATGTTNGLAFLTSNLIVLSSKTCDYVAQGTPRALRVVAHELAHRWFGGLLRATGPGTRWLVESFAEYYAWRVVRAKAGVAAYDEVLAQVRKEAGSVPTSIPALGWEDDRVYSAGSLGVLALGEAVGEASLDRAVRTISEAEGEWSADALFRALTSSGADRERLERWRSDWGFDAR